jgi:hypothetical protein
VGIAHPQAQCVWEIQQGMHRLAWGVGAYVGAGPLPPLVSKLCRTSSVLASVRTGDRRVTYVKPVFRVTLAAHPICQAGAKMWGTIFLESHLVVTQDLCESAFLLVV